MVKRISRRQQNKMQAQLTKPSWMSRAACPAHGQPAEWVQQGEGLLDDVAQPAQALIAGVFGCGMTGWVPRSRQTSSKGFTAVRLVGQQGREAASWVSRSAAMGG
ncbi:hypothetical protein [Couchioplanes azureus]|uniref:hypothetical protein n=1 Tax=Couchioplanes caeruleus TaxID=56438 RepID=UPI00166FA8E1|nr:hypothetical protein [Couchioplanes caeruleus]GGQ56296.1 hypothetical protein GCM10010166_27200 [Couchioplanes caeruleus subsp. azureus]